MTRHTIHIDKTTTLTTNHAMSSYNQPVLVRDGVAYGPSDWVDEGIFGLISAQEIVRNFVDKLALRIAMTRGGVTPDDAETALLAKFLD